MADTFVSGLTWLPDELITSTKMNLIGQNITNLHNGTALADGIIVTRHIGAAADLEFGSYSTSEQATRYKWIDGKTIYQKTVNFGTLPNNTTKSVAHGITGIDSLIKIDIIGASGGNQYPIPQYFNNNMFSAPRISTRVDNTQINISTDLNISTHTAVATLYYTKS